MLQVRLLGQFDVQLNDAPVQIPSRPAQSLLAYLMLNAGKAQRRERLAGLLWPDSSESNARANLRQALWRLRKAIGADFILTDKVSVTFDAAAPYWLDVAVLETSSLEIPSADDLIELLSVYAGELLPGFYDEWVVWERERLCAVFEDHMQSLLDRLTEEGRWQELHEWAERWIAGGQVPEPAYRALMLAHAELGDQAGMAAVYQRCVDALENELGVAPSLETSQLHQRLSAREKPSQTVTARDDITAEKPERREDSHDRYRLGPELGGGSMGVVYRAHDTVLKRQVAIKMIKGAGLDSQARTRVLREAQIAARLNHPNIVSVHDAGETDDALYIVMELVEGRSLQELRPQEMDEILAITRQVCLALEHAHANGIVHRDLKPENVLVSPDGSVKLVDFGLARSVASRLTSEGTLVGTVFYLAPELALGEQFDGRADLYALGVMLYELTTRRLPFSASDPVAVISQHLHAPIVPPRARSTQVPRALDALILRLLSKNPDDRPASATEVLDILKSPTLLDQETAPEEPVSVLIRIERGRLVGRERELWEARTLWNRALSSQGQVLLISGEPGVGKSRLARELVTQVQVSGGTALVGACYAEGGTPYAPFARILRRIFDHGFGDDLNLPDFALADLLTLAPALRLRYSAVAPNPKLDDPRAEQHRLAESLALLVTVLSERTPLLLVVEDAQWAESGTLFLLRHLARRLQRRPVMLLITFRGVDLDEAPSLHELLLDLQRERLATHMKLPRLNRKQTQELLAVLFDEEITPGFLDGFYGRTEGNPFFIEEVCKALAESGELRYQDGRWYRPSMEELGIPHSVRVAIQSRVGVLPRECQETLRLAAVLGREFDLNVLAEASQLSGDDLIDALDDAERAQLIEEGSGELGETFAFAHALIPDTLVEALRTLQRRRLHRRAATAIEARRPDDFEALAYHWDRASDPQKARGYMVKAGQRAARQYANQEALDYFEQALERVAAGDEVNHILEQRAKILLDLYQGEEAAHDYERLLESARGSGDRNAELDVLLGLASAYYVAALDAKDMDFAPRYRQLCEEALALARELGDKASLTRALIATQNYGTFWLEGIDEVVANVEEALGLSQEIDDEELIIECSMAWVSFASLGLLNAPELEEQAETLLSALESRRDLPRLKETYWYLMWAYLSRGEFEKCVSYCDAGIRLAEAIGAPPVQYPTLKALALLNLGRYDDAWNSLGEEVTDKGHHFGRAMQDIGTGIYLLELAAYERAATVFESTVEQAESLRRIWISRWAQSRRVISLIRAEKLDDVTLEQINQDLASIGLALPPEVLAEVALVAGRLDEALQQAQTACSEAENGGFRPACVIALEVRLRVLLRLEGFREVVSLADVGIQMAQEMGYRPMLWRIRAAKAQALELLGETEAAAREYRAAAEIITALVKTVGDPDLKQGYLSDDMVSSIIAAAFGSAGEAI